MTDEEFILHLQEENPDSLPQFDVRIVHHCYLPRNQAIVLRKPETIPIGYLLHSPIRAGESFRLDAFCISILYRHSGFGRELFQKLITRAQTYHASEVRLTCPSDLPACQFFERMEMLDTRQTRETARLKRLLTCWRLKIQPKPTPENPPRRRLAAETANGTPWPNGR